MLRFILFLFVPAVVSAQGLKPAPLSICDVSLHSADSAVARAFYTEQVQKWSTELGQQFQGIGPSSGGLPKKISRVDQLRNDWFISQAKAPMKTILSRFFGSNTTAFLQSRVLGSGRQELETVAQTQVLDALNMGGLAAFFYNLASSNVGRLVGGPMHEWTLDVMSRNALGTSDFQVWMGTVKNYQQNYVEDLTHLIQSLQNQGLGGFISNEAAGKAAMNAIGMRVMAYSGAADVPSREAVNALALLHPITDDAIDQQIPGLKDSMVKIALFLKGQSVKATSGYESVVFHLLSQIETAFPRQEHSLLWDTLSRLHEVQIESGIRQSGLGEAAKRLSSEDLFRITAEKGGLSSIAFGYLTFGKLTHSQVEYFYKGGTVYQMLDDFLDFEQDLRSGYQTVWTVTNKSRSEISKTMNGLLRMQYDLVKNGESLLKGLKSPEGFHRYNDFSFRMLSAMALLDPEMVRLLDSDSIRRVLPISVNSLHSTLDFVIHELHRNGPMGRHFLKQIDTLLLNGRLSQ